MPDETFTEKTKVKQNFKEIGRSGTLVTADTVEDDHISALVGVEGQEVFKKMLLSDSTIRKLYHAVSNPIRSASWDIEPASKEQKDIDAAALMKQIIFKDLPDGFTAKLDEILTFPWHGHAVFEVIHKNRTSKQFGAYTGLDNIAFRDQRTLDKWKFSSSGILERIHQLQSGDIEVNVDMEADTLLIFYNEKKGNDTGYAFCRMLYGNYNRKLLYKQLQAIGIEKGAIGVPILTLPPQVDTDDDNYTLAVDQLEAYTQAENSYMILPDGYEMNLDQANTFDPAKVQVAIKSENEEIAGSLIAMFLEMGIGGNAAVGSSTGESIEFFKGGIEYIADKIADKFNLELIPNLMALNFGDTFDALPTLAHSGISDKVGKELMEIVTGYTDKGVIQKDEQLEDHVRKVHRLPKKAEGEMLENQETTDEDPNPDNNTDDNSLPDKDDELELSDKDRTKSPKVLITEQGKKVALEISAALEKASSKYVNDVIVKYRQLPENKKQNATSKIIMSGTGKLKKSLNKILAETALLSIKQAKLEIPAKKNVELSSKESDLLRMDQYISNTTIKLNDASTLPTHIQVLIQKQSDLISAASMDELKNRIDFSFSSMEVKTKDELILKQSMEEATANFSESNQVVVKGNNVSALVVNEGRDTFFFDDDVIEEIHSFTFVNIAPVSPVCRELAGVTFNTNDAQSMIFSPPLHHNCKSYLRANLKTSKGIKNLEVGKLAPSEKAQKSITL